MSIQLIPYPPEDMNGREIFRRGYKFGEGQEVTMSTVLISQED